jgi:outer membrane protein assembly factor BamA
MCQSQRWIGIIGLLLLAALQLHGQRYQLQILLLSTDSQRLARSMEWPASTYNDSLQLLQGLNDFVTQLHAAAYLEASADTLVWQDRVCHALLHLGPAYEWVALEPGNTPPEWLNRVGFRERLYRKQPLRFGAWQQLQAELVETAAERGFPFAQITLDSLRWLADGQVTAQIHTQAGALIRNDPLRQIGDLRLNPRYLAQYLGWLPDQAYNEAIVQALPQRLRELPFVQLRQPPKIQFVGDRAQLELDLAARPASRFDFVVGVLPRSNQTGRLLITGQVDGALQNALGQGESIALQFEQLRPQTQNLEMQLSYPYFLQLPFGLETRLDLYRRDTNFINLSWELGVNYLLPNNRRMTAFWGRDQTNLLTIDSSELIRKQQLPDTLDVRRDAFGLGLQWATLDYRLNPRRGWAIQLRASAGRRRIQPNARISELGYGSLYDSLDTRNTQYRLEGQLARYWPLGQRGVVKFGLRGAALLGELRPLANEQFRIGGNRQLRGFDEESIFASNYLLGTLEYRFLLATNSYLYAFWDLAWVDQQTLRQEASRRVDWPQGLGAGITFETRAGLFGLSLAFGRQLDLPFDFGAPKVHFGYVSLF